MWVATHTTRSLTIESVRVNPLTLGVTLQGVTLSEAGETTTPFVSFKRLDLALSLRSLWERAVILRRLHLEGPKVRLVRTAVNTYNFADLQALGDSTPKVQGSRSSEKSKPLLFSVNNISLADGHIDFIDRARPQEKHHIVSELNLGVPFIGNVPYLTDLYVTPSLHAKVNGAPFQFEGKLKPFKDGSETTLDLNFKDFDLAYYTSYLPATLPLRIKSGLFDSQVSIAYRVFNGQKPEIELSGLMHLAGFKAEGVDATPLMTIRDFSLEFLPSRPLDGDFFLKTVNLKGVQLSAHRNRLGEWNLPGLQPQDKAAPPSSVEEKPVAEEVSSPLRLRIQSLQLAESSIDFHDELPTGGFKTRLQQMEGELNNFDNNSPLAAALSLNFTTDRHEALSIKGGFALKPFSTDFDLELEHLPLAAYYPYLQTRLTAPVSGALSLQSHLQYDEESGLRLTAGSLELEDFHVPFRRGEEFFLPKLAAHGVEVDLNRQLYHVEELVMEQGRVKLSRLSDGRWSPLELIQKSEKPEAPAVVANRQQPESAPHFSLGRLRLNHWRAEFRDETLDNPIELNDLTLEADGFEYPEFTVNRAVLTASSDGGRMNLNTGGRLVPLDLTGRLQLKQLPLSQFWAYVPPKVRILLVTGDLDSDLRFHLMHKQDQLFGNCRGSLGIGDLYLVNADNADDLLRWEHFDLEKMALDFDQSRLSIEEIALSGLVAQLTITPEGTLNFSKVVEEDAPVVPVLTKEVETIAAPPTLPAPSTPPSREWFVAIDKVTLQNGRIDFTDQHMTPAFHAQMINLGGRISGLSTAPEMQADVDVRGNLESRSPIQIIGTMNPLSKTPQIDLKIVFKDIELSPVSPYTGRYLGYTVDKGKLFLDLKYRIVDKKLEATNKVFIDQFTFGSSVDSPDAIKLPVKLAVALLKDRNGEIHLNVPVTGRTDDPEFSIWRIVWKVIKNLLVKAATSPFALLTSFSEGLGDFSEVVFEPGSAVLSAADRERLAQLASALSARPTIKLQLTGHAEKTIDQEAYRRQLLENRIKRFKFMELARKKELSPGQTAEIITVTVAERPRYLKEVYKKEDFPKPRNVIGLLKDLPDEEMEKLLLSHTVIGPEQLSELAWSRSTAVKNELVERNGFPAERIFLNNVEIVRPKNKGDDWSGNRVEFGVAAD